MNQLAEHLKRTADAVLAVNSTEIEIGNIRCNASIAYSNDLGMPDISERQTTTVSFSIDDVPDEPAIGTEIKETESGRTHRIRKVTYSVVVWVCECELRHNKYTGPFK